VPDTPARTALVLVSHSAAVADGTAELAAQMAPGVVIETAGGRPDGGLGTDFDRVEAAVSAALGAGADEAGGGVVVLADLGSAVLTVESVQDLLDDGRSARVRLAEAPFVEGAVAAAVSAQGGGDLAEVTAAAQGAGRAFVIPDAAEALDAVVAAVESGFGEA
jgi:PTS hybrid protein